jgi:hypothetical protein
MFVDKGPLIRQPYDESLVYCMMMVLHVEMRSTVTKPCNALMVMHSMEKVVLLPSSFTSSASTADYAALRSSAAYSRATLASKNTTLSPRTCPERRGLTILSPCTVASLHQG